MQEDPREPPNHMSARVPRDIPIEVIKEYVVEAPDPPRRLEPGSLFDSPGPVEVEIGFGKGRFLVTAAELQPKTRFLGIEIRHVLRDFVAARLAKRSLRNARVMQADARSFMREVVPDASLAAIHFYFPDPWWKKRHYKRRIWTTELFADFERTLTPGGVLHLASDVSMVFDEMRARADERTGLREDRSADIQPPCTTNFEDKASEEGRAVGRTAFVRV